MLKKWENKLNLVSTELKGLWKRRGFWVLEEIEDFRRDSRSFSYRWHMEGLNKFVVETDTNVNDWLMDIHFEAMRNFPSWLLLLKSRKGVSNICRVVFSKGWFNWNLVRLYRRSQRTINKIYKWIDREKDNEGRKLSKENVDIFNAFDWKTVSGAPIESLKEAFTDLTTLTILTNGKKDAEGKVTTYMRTDIKLLTGDIISDTPFEGDQLVAYHEKMFDLSINITKTYSQIFIQLLSIFLPWSGLKIPEGTLDKISELSKAMYQVESKK